MNSQREIHGFDQAVVLLMFALDRVFAHRVEGWRRPRRGFIIKIIESFRNSETDQAIAIYSVGLPKNDVVYCRLFKYGGIWCDCEGNISFDHSIREIQNFHFEAHLGVETVEHLIRARSDEEKFKEIIARDRIYSCLLC